MQTGDVIVSLDGKPIANSAALRLALVKFHPGESVRVGWVDSTGKRHEASVKLIVGRSAAFKSVAANAGEPSPPSATSPR